MRPAEVDTKLKALLSDALRTAEAKVGQKVGGNDRAVRPGPGSHRPRLPSTPRSDPACTLWCVSSQDVELQTLRDELTAARHQCRDMQAQLMIAIAERTAQEVGFPLPPRSTSSPAPFCLTCPAC